ncbi:hypothetical protein D3C86_1941440 [compost metagenome]
MAGDIGFQRKLVQQRLAEGVDGLDFQPARCFQRLGKQPARFGKLDAIRRLAFDGGDAVLKIGIRQSRPFRQTVENTARHFRRRGLGIGEAQNRRRPAAGQKQANDALGQDMGLA